MNYKITGYKPEKLFHFFEDISAIPRGSAITFDPFNNTYLALGAAVGRAFHDGLSLK